MFGFKKKQQIVETVAPVREEPKITEMKCLKCGAMCTRTPEGNFRCKFCGAKFTDTDAEIMASKRADAREEREAEIEKELEQKKAEARLAEAKAAEIKAAEAIAVAKARAEEAKAIADAKAAEIKIAEAKAQEARAAERMMAQAQRERTQESSLPKVSVTVESVNVTTEMSSEDIYSYNCNGVVEIITNYGRASGLIISKKGFVLTNAHAVLDPDGNVSESIYVKHGGDAIRSRVIAIGNTDSNDPNNVDLALLHMESIPELAVSLKLGRSDTVRIGEHVYYIGNSKGEGLCMTAGIVSDNNRKVGERYFIMTDAATNPGNSGGPLFNDEGEVIGVHVSARNEAVGMKYAIPINTVRLFLNTIEERLGIPLDTIADDLVTVPEMSNESLTVGAVIALVLSGIAVLVKGLEFAKEIADIVE